MHKACLRNLIRSTPIRPNGGFRVDDIVDHLIAHCVTVSEWIPTMDELPAGIEDHYQQYGEYPEFIVMIAEGVLPTTLFFDGEGWFDHANEYYSVTHWMPLPLPPRDLSVLQKL